MSQTVDTQVSDRKLFVSAKKLGRISENLEDIRHEFRKADKQSPIINELGDIISRIEKLPTMCQGLSYSRERFNTYAKQREDKQKKAASK